MSGGLDDYEKKRDFEKTREPAAEPRGARADRTDATEPLFVVHRHEARNLHYDLRVSMNGALASWAVPKGFSYDPSDKRLAVRTEDHPLEYLEFEGRIPQGQYGAGTMTVWDSGRFEAKPAKEGEYKLVLYGRKLRGEWHLVKTQGGPNHWLLFKSRDRYAGPKRDTALGVDLSAARVAAPPRRPRAMRPGEAARPFTDPSWLFEMEFEGRRLFARIEPGDDGTRGARLSGLPGAPAALLDELAQVRAESALLDGVLVAIDERQRPSRALLDERLAAGSLEGVAYYAFDLLYWDGFDLRGLPLLARKQALRVTLPDRPHVLFVDHVAGEGERLAGTAAGAGLAGLVAKRADSTYSSGASDAWRRVDLDAAPGAAQRDPTSALARAPRRKTRVKLSNLDKVFWPVEGLTKGDLLDYYEAVAGALVPHLSERPCHMLRYPDGIEGKSFYQHRAPDGVPDWVDVEEIANEKGEITPYVIAGDRDALLYLANLGSIDLHPWLSRRGSPDSPDWAVIDLDPKTAPFGDVIKLARAAGRLLRGIGTRPLLKTSGKTGLHVYLPLAEGYTYEQARLFCEALARVLAREHKDIATVERVIGEREGKVYVDYLQNARGQTVVPPYAVRPVPGASVSTPLAWDELEDELDPGAFTLRTMPARLASLGDLFRPALEDRQELGPAIESLQGYLRGE